jgi:ABC-2 type transport system permease protein
MRSWARIFFVGGLIAYRGLFNWIRPSIYIPTLLGGPLFQIFFFTYLGRYATNQPDSFFVVGNAIQVCAMASVYGMAMAVANERWSGTLGPLLASPANRAAVFLGRGVPVLANGLIVSAFGFAVGALALDFRPGWQAVPALATVVLASVASCTAFGMLLGSIGLRAKDFMFAANMANFLLLLFCGVNIPLATLPGWMEAVGRCLPLTHGIIAARDVAAGADLAEVGGLVWTELGIGAAYAVAAYVLFRVLEQASRRSAVLDSL